jgi:hypothetical protein
MNCFDIMWFKFAQKNNMTYYKITDVTNWIYMNQCVTVFGCYYDSHSTVRIRHISNISNF